MAANPRNEATCGSTDGVSFGYPNTQRNHFVGGSTLDRGPNFRESHDTRTVVQGAAGSSVASSSTGDLQSLSQVLALELIPSWEQKYARQQLELRRAMLAATGVSSEVHGNLQPKPLEQQTVEELKRVKASLLENAARARERSRGLSEATSKLDKYRASRKRVRSEAFGQERPMTSLSVERSMPAGNLVKPSLSASPNHIADSGAMKQEEKNKGGVVPNKRVRTSMVDVRLDGRTSTSNFQRPTGLGDRDRDSFKSSSSIPTLVEEKDRPASTSGEGWERSKMKGRRSGTKSESLTPHSANGTTEVERDHKWGAQHRSITDNRCKPSEGHGFRSGPVHGVVSMHKIESAQQNAGLVRPLNKIESEGSPSMGDKGDRVVFPDKERSLLKSGVKLSNKEDVPVHSPTAITKAKSARAPRSNTGILVNPTAHTSRPPAPDVWDRAQGRAQPPVGPTNRKRPAPSRPSSPPVAQWVRQRPQKMARIARRMNLVPPVCPVGGTDDTVPMGDGNNPRDSNGGAGVRVSPSIPTPASLVKKLASTSTLSQAKLKSEKIATSGGLSESEDSEGGDVKSKEKWKKHGEPEAKFAVVNQKMAPVVIPGKKSRIVSKEEGGDGVRRQGRSSRGLMAVRESVAVTHVEKVDPASNAKQLRSARSGPEKPHDVKPGRPPSKKGTSDRKALTRPRRPVTNGSADISGESDDDHEELVAAIQAAVNASAAACTNSFWKEMEPFFVYLTTEERESLRKQARQLEETELLLARSVDECKNEKDVTDDTISSEPLVRSVGGRVSCLANGSKELAGGPPLSQRLIAALIIEVDMDSSRRDDESQSRGCIRHASLQGLSDSEQMDQEKKDEDSESDMEVRRGGNRQYNGWAKSPRFDGSCISNGHRQWDSESELLNSPAKAETRKEDGLQYPDSNGLSNLDTNYWSLGLDDRIALELQSAGLYPDPADLIVREDDEIAKQLQKSHIDLKDQIHANKERLTSLEIVVSRSRAAEERERERLAMSKLVEIAFTKRVGCRGGVVGVPGIKSSASKGARAAALTFAKRALARWRHFTETGESCFTDPVLRNNLFCIVPENGEAKSLTIMGEIQGVGINLLGSSKLKPAVSDGSGRLLPIVGMDKADLDSSESGQVAANSSERFGDKDDIASSRLKEREALLKDVGSVGPGNILGGTKGKRSERERDGKSQGKEIVGSSKGVRQALGTIKGERKTKTKPRQKTAPLLKAVNGLLGKPSEVSKDCGSSPDRSLKPKEELLSGVAEVQPEAEGALDLSHLPIPSMDELGGQGQDLGSWLDFEDPVLGDTGGDYMGLHVPMDDLADLVMM